MDKFKIVIDGQEYETEAASEDQAKEKIQNHLNKNKTKNENNSKTKNTETVMSEEANTRTIVDYQIFTSDSSSSLQLSVKSLISNSSKNKTWEPIGGVSICNYQGKGLIGGISRYEFAQAMVCYYTKK
jgi:hypothetical protein